MGIAAKKRGHAIAIQVLVVVLLAGGHADRELVLVLAVVLAVVGAAADVFAAIVLRGRGVGVAGVGGGEVRREQGAARHGRIQLGMPRRQAKALRAGRFDDRI